MRIDGHIAVSAGTLCLVAIMVAGLIHQGVDWWTIPFLAIFVPLFGGILTVCFSIYRSERFRIRARRTHPDQPWMWDRRWQSEVLPSRGASEFWGLLAMTVVLMSFAVSGLAAMREGWVDGNLWTLLGLIPLGAALYYGRVTWRAWLAWRLSRHVTLVLETRPARVSSDFRARLELERHVSDRITARLEHSTVRQVMDGGEYVYSTVTTRTVPAHVALQVDAGGQPVACISAHMPVGSPETSWTETEARGWWDMVVQFGGARSDLELRYEVPVAGSAKQVPDEPGLSE
ncbi:hypothetical protein KUV51_19780 [Tateyamaria omphalii]|uniref:hypothetical protein n=1 Tax=Tateyamaria omphalii TaxID=299262 RepID=UPI001C995B1B|nr:hypothetical protein [Tateyamaria omphalii]MBY5935256.1 hypothetical protein [Tateyamaria omphalii]